jgi:hypothetical protein
VAARTAMRSLSAEVAAATMYTDAEGADFGFLLEQAWAQPR